MRSTTIALALAGLITATAPAQAAPTVTFFAGSGATAPGTTVFQTFEGFAPNAAIGTNAYAVTASSGNAARPAYGSTGKFGAVLGGGSWTVNFAAASVFSFVLGSLDTYNSLTLFFADGSSLLYQGGQIINDMTFPSGSQISGETNGVVRYSAGSGPAIVGARFQSAQNSFEFDNLASTGAVPEPATWAMMMLGFGAMGTMLRRRRRDSRALRLRVAYRNRNLPRLGEGG